jgi:hypothetical protein
MKNVKMLLALSGISDENNKPDCALTAFGTCAVLAAERFLGDVVERIGENEIARWLDSNGVRPPHSDGLWVIECVKEKDASLPGKSSISLKKWRLPMQCEIDALLRRQLGPQLFFKGLNPYPITKDGKWVFCGFQGLPTNSSRKKVRK